MLHQINDCFLFILVVTDNFYVDVNKFLGNTCFRSVVKIDMESIVIDSVSAVLARLILSFLLNFIVELDLILNFKNLIQSIFL